MGKWHNRELQISPLLRENHSRVYFLAICGKCRKSHPADLVANVAAELMKNPLRVDHPVSIQVLCVDCAKQMDLQGQVIEINTERSVEDVLGISLNTPSLHLEEE